MKIGARSARLRALLIAACALAVFAAGALPARGLWRGEHHEQRNELFQMEEKWRNAVLRGDAAAMASLLDDDYMAITSNGMLQSREQTLAHMRSGTIRFRSIIVPTARCASTATRRWLPAARTWWEQLPKAT